MAVFGVGTWLPPDLTEAAVTDAALEPGLGVFGLAPCWVGKRGPDELVFGYGSLTEPTIVEGVDLVPAAIGSLRGQ